MLTKQDIKEKLADNINLLKKYNIKRIGLFGSYVKGIATEESDIDLIIDFSETIDLFEFVHLSDSIKNIFDKEADLITLDGIKPAIKENILNEVEWLERL